MIGLLGLLGFLGGVVVGGAAGWLAAGVSGADKVLWATLGGLGAGGLLGFISAMFGWAMVPPALKDLLVSVRTGFVVVGIGSDKKIRFIPAESDGYIIKPTKKPYSNVYKWVADGESSYPIHKGKGMQALIAYMGYPWGLSGEKAAAIARFREMGFESVEDLKILTELPTVEDVDRRIGELEAWREQLKRASDEEVREQFGGLGREDLLARAEVELDRLYRLRSYLQELEQRGLSGRDVAAVIEGATVKAKDLIAYLVWRHTPQQLDNVIKAELNAIMSKMKLSDWIKPYAGITMILLGMGMLLIVLFVLGSQFIGGGEAVEAAGEGGGIVESIGGSIIGGGGGGEEALPPGGTTTPSEEPQPVGPPG